MSALFRKSGSMVLSGTLESRKVGGGIKEELIVVGNKRGKEGKRGNINKQGEGGNKKFQVEIFKKLTLRKKCVFF